MWTGLKWFIVIIHRGNKRTNRSARTKVETVGERKTTIVHAVEKSPQWGWNKKKTTTERNKVSNVMLAIFIKL